MKLEGWIAYNDHMVFRATSHSAEEMVEIANDTFEGGYCIKPVLFEVESITIPPSDSPQQIDTDEEV
jgi:hypothetical protein